jgi:hypothetical protein
MIDLINRTECSYLTANQTELWNDHLYIEAMLYAGQLRKTLVVEE